MLVWYGAVRGLVEFWNGDPSRAVARFAAAEQAGRVAEVVEPSVYLWRADHVEALLELGRISDAVGVLDAWEADATRVGREWVLAQVTRCRGFVAAAQADVEQAQSLLEEAVAKHEAVGDPFGRARALLSLGVVRRRARQNRAAREAIEAAVAGFEELGAATWVEKARAEARPRRWADARRGPHARRATRGGTRRCGPDEPRGRRYALPRRAHGGEPPDPHLREARRALADGARAAAAVTGRAPRAQSSDVLTFPPRRRRP